MSINFILYSRPDCRLCDEMVNQLRKIDQFDKHQLQIVDISSDQALLARYGSRIPVLIANNKLLCQFRLDHNAVVDCIKSVED